MDFENLKSFAEMQSDLDSSKDTPPKETKEPEVKDSEASTPKEETGDNPEETKEGVPGEENTDKDETPWGKSGKVPKGISERFRKLTERDRQKDARIRDLEATVKKFLDTGAKDSKEPTLQDFLEAGKSENDFINYLVEQRMNARTQVDEQKRKQEEHIKRAQTELQEKWSKAIEKSKLDLPDYDEVIASADVVLPTNTMRFITESDIGPYISYTIASDEGLQTKIDNMQDPASKHAVVIEVEKTVRAWLANRDKKSSVQPNAGNGKPKVPGSLKNGSKAGKVLDPATATIEEWLGIE